MSGPGDQKPASPAAATVPVTDPLARCGSHCSWAARSPVASSTPAGQGAGQERARVQGAAELGVHHARLGLGPGEAAELRRDHQPGQAEIAGQPGVQFLAVASLGLQRGAQRLRRELVGEEGAQGVLQSALVLVERRGFAIGHEAASSRGAREPEDRLRGPRAGGFMLADKDRPFRAIPGPGARVCRAAG